ncbi:hypothetical protein Ahy_B10g101458 isoform B [Arachis hypogaea]|uniref:Uncharacterized protein n=1 Tax=Arachis hypogaea TaxID=3818 RepID=A0A444WZM9_ARAHY|nr:hypothetical protein Ahy_B10g101458 isoform B [Arachis hypogaea]
MESVLSYLIQRQLIQTRTEELTWNSDAIMKKARLSVREALEQPINRRSWKEIRNRLDHECYKSTKTLEQNIEERPPGIDKEHWRWFLEYRNKPETQEKIMEIEQRDKSSKMLSEDDSFVQALRKEHSGRVRGVGFGTTPSQLFHPSSHLSMDGAQTENTQRMLFELQAEVVDEKLKRKAMENVVAAEKIVLLCYLIQWQCRELPLDIDARLNFLEGQSER